MDGSSVRASPSRLRRRAAGSRSRRCRGRAWPSPPPQRCEAAAVRRPRWRRPAANGAAGSDRRRRGCDRRPLDLADWVLRGVAVPHQVLVERRQRGEPAADRRRRRMLGLPHEPLPGDHRLVVGLTQFIGAGDHQRVHEVLDVEPVGAAGARFSAFAARILLRGWQRAGRGSRVGCRRSGCATRRRGRRPGLSRAGAGR
jgi:hypothetical protein